MFAAQQLFEILKSYRNSYFSELYSYKSLDFNNDLSDEEDNSEDDDYAKNLYVEIGNNFTVEEMENIIEWIDEHPSYGFSTIQHRFRKIKSINYISRFREYIERNGTSFVKLEKIKEFMLDEFYIKKAIEKEAVHDTDLQQFAIQKAKELGWNNYKACATFIKSLKKNNRISSRRYNKLITRETLNRKACSLKGI